MLYEDIPTVMSDICQIKMETSFHIKDDIAIERSIEEVKAAAGTAGIQVDSRPIQILHFGDRLSECGLKLMEVPSDLLQEIKTGTKIVMRGEQHDEAVLCTQNKTYDMKEAQSSNSLLLCPSLKYPQDEEMRTLNKSSLIPTEVTACAFSYFELRQCRPKLEKLKRLLNEFPYKGELQERSGENDGKTKYTYCNLLDMVQASEDELLNGLKLLQACSIDGYWRVFDLDYRDQVLQSILTLLEEEDWSWNSIPLLQTCQKLEELEPAFVIEHFLECYGVEFTGEEGERRYKLLEDKVCQFCAELFLRQAGKFNYQEFMESWPTSVPLGMTTSIDQLKGLALTDMASVPAVIWYFPVTELPEDPAARFSKLFSVKEKWSYDELYPYISDLESPGQSLKGLLLKYSRVSGSTQGTKTYNAKLTAL